MNLFKRYANRLLIKAEDAIEKKDLYAANRFAKKALALNSSLEDGWLILAATSPEIQSHDYLKKVIQLNPNNIKAKNGLIWLENLNNNLARNLPDIPHQILAETNELEIPNHRHRPIKSRTTKRWKSILVIISIIFIFVIAASAPLLSPLSGNEQEPWFKVVCTRLRCPSLPPDNQYLMGTIKEYDVFHTLIWGTRQALFFGLTTAGLTSLLGITLGSIAGFKRNWISRIIMRICDAFLAFPVIAGIALFSQIISYLSISVPRIYQIDALEHASHVPTQLSFLQNLIVNADPVLISLVLFSWMPFARITQSKVIQVKNAEYINAARAVGNKNGRILLKHIIPNSITPAIILATRDVGKMVVIQASMTFIGVGSSSSWAKLLNEGKDWIVGPGGNLITRWWFYLPITLAVIFFGVTWSMLGEELNHRLNPRNL